MALVAAVVRPHVLAQMERAARNCAKGRTFCKIRQDDPLREVSDDMSGQEVEQVTLW